MSNLQDMTLVELRNLAKENNIKNISKLKKEDLITVLIIKQIIMKNKKKLKIQHNMMQMVSQ